MQLGVLVRDLFFVYSPRLAPNHIYVTADDSTLDFEAPENPTCSTLTCYHSLKSTMNDHISADYILAVIT